MEEEKTTTQPEQPVEPQQPVAPPSEPQAEAPPVQSKTILLAVTALLLIFIAVGTIYLFQLTQTKTPIPRTTPAQQATLTTPPLPTPTPQDLAVPTVSEDTTLETIEKELNETKISSPESDIEELDNEASQL